MLQTQSFLAFPHLLFTVASLIYINLHITKRESSEPDDFLLSVEDNDNDEHGTIDREEVDIDEHNVEDNGAILLIKNETTH